MRMPDADLLHPSVAFTDNVVFADGGTALAMPSNPFSYTSLLPYPPQTLATLTASRLRRSQDQAPNGSASSEAYNRSAVVDANRSIIDPRRASSDLCFMHLGRAGGSSLIEGFVASNITNLVVVAAALSPPVLTRTRTPHEGMTVYRYEGPLAEGLPSFSPCVDTGRVVTWVRDPISRFLSTWHAGICFESDCDDRRLALWEALVAMRLVDSNSGARLLDLNLVIDELARRDGGEQPGQATLSFLRAIEHGVTGVLIALPLLSQTQAEHSRPHGLPKGLIQCAPRRTGLASYLPDCSVDFLKRHPMRFVGRTEHMQEDWLKLFNGNQSAAPTLGQERHYAEGYPSRTLSQSSRDWLRTFYRDDFLCMGNLGETGMLDKSYIEKVRNEEKYEFWPALSNECFDKWGESQNPATLDYSCTIEPWPRPLVDLKATRDLSLLPRDLVTDTSSSNATSSSNNASRLASWRRLVGAVSWR